MVVFSITWLGILSCLLTYFLFIIYLGQKSTKWPSTMGTLLDFKVVRDRSISVKLKYEYEVNGKKYIGKRLSFITPNFGSEKEIETDKFCNHIKKDEFQVYYFEKYPNVSTLQTGGKGWASAVLVIMLYVVGICAIAVASINYSKQEHQIKVKDQQGGGTPLRRIR